ncbi:hypothetical protein TREAZ_3289 [Leadbettera azotonutricia ZAS-9]|uniref:Uncharacterized protein n=1 Tax=Leadbettera azotonutricia (strain ATCC BAA-888 / DSM 13862 / ZAS-9) TaxID=545695 RepID=F5Y930_LEAAZ|nr:hypothetical protein TREAZ_3289 [Leadbettera azotonutricia ZAS-9]
MIANTLAASRRLLPNRQLVKLIFVFIKKLLCTLVSYPSSLSPVSAVLRNGARRRFGCAAGQLGAN